MILMILILCRAQLLEKDTVPVEAKILSEEETMAAMMGFGGFSTSKGSQVEDNTVGPGAGAIQRKGKREYRQYMNRRGAFAAGAPE